MLDFYQIPFYIYGGDHVTEACHMMTYIHWLICVERSLCLWVGTAEGKVENIRHNTDTGKGFENTFWDNYGQRAFHETKTFLFHKGNCKKSEEAACL